MIDLNNVTMDFIFPSDKITGIKEFILKFVQGKIHMRHFRALDGVSVHVNKGEVLGVIGHNGAGKSTLLKIISGLYNPSNGSVKIDGNVVPMLELGAGFDFELTGRENIFLNGALLGYSKKFLEENYESIVDFSGIREFIDVPLKNYSSGMIMRLAFSISSVVDPDILIVDEILAVGDDAFQKKSRARMKELMEGGTTVVFVSHSLEQIRELCSHVLWLEKGHVVAYGETEEICNRYAEEG